MQALRHVYAPRSSAPALDLPDTSAQANRGDPSPDGESGVRAQVAARSSSEMLKLPMAVLKHAGAACACMP